MLKIAEYNTITGKKIDLKELEKYGFKLINTNTYGELDYYQSSSIIVQNTTRHIRFCKNPYDRKLELLYDLIKDGLIEKVEE